MSTPKNGTRPKNSLRDAPHDWLWYLIAGAAIDDLVRGVSLLRTAIWHGICACFIAWLTTVLLFIGVLHFRPHFGIPVLGWLIANTPALSLFRSVRLALVLATFLGLWVTYHVIKAVLRGFAPKTYTRIAIQFIRVRDVLRLVLKVVFARHTWADEGGMAQALSNALDADSLSTEHIRDKRERATWDLRTVDWSSSTAKADALRMVMNAFNAAYVARFKQEPAAMPRAVRSGGKTARGVYVELKFPKGQTYKTFGGGDGRAGCNEELKSFLGLPHAGSIAWVTDGMEANEVGMMLNYIDPFDPSVPVPDDDPEDDE